MSRVRERRCETVPRDRTIDGETKIPVVLRGWCMAWRVDANQVTVHANAIQHNYFYFSHDARCAIIVHCNSAIWC